jgi:hypothetical protein
MRIAEKPVYFAAKRNGFVDKRKTVFGFAYIGFDKNRLSPFQTDIRSEGFPAGGIPAGKYDKSAAVSADPGNTFTDAFGPA